MSMACPRRRRSKSGLKTRPASVRRTARFGNGPGAERGQGSPPTSAMTTPFEALSILTLQQREGQSFSAVLGGGAILHQGLASDVKLLQFEQDLASGWARLQFQQ